MCYRRRLLTNSNCQTSQTARLFPFLSHVTHHTRDHLIFSIHFKNVNYDEKNTKRPEGGPPKKREKKNTLIPLVRLVTTPPSSPINLTFVSTLPHLFLAARLILTSSHALGLPRVYQPRNHLGRAIHRQPTYTQCQPNLCLDLSLDLSLDIESVPKSESHSHLVNTRYTHTYPYYHSLFPTFARSVVCSIFLHDGWAGYRRC